MRFKFLKLVSVLNLPREICHHLIGTHHKPSHRMICGTLVMAAGVAIAHTAPGFPHYMAMAVDGIGYGIHALGATPFIEALLAEA